MAFIEHLPRVVLSDAYTEKDRANDFVMVFFGDSNAAQGQRVLAQIQAFCSPPPNPADSEKPGLAQFKEGRRWVFNSILAAFVSGRRTPRQQKKEGGDEVSLAG